MSAELRMTVGPGVEPHAEIHGDVLQLKSWIDQRPDELEEQIAEAVGEALRRALSELRAGARR